MLKLFFSSVIQKWVMALTGAFLAFFLTVHLAGNLLIFAGPQAFNAYAHFLTTHAFIYPIEAILVCCFTYHAIYGVTNRLRNYRRARQQSYHIRQQTKGSRRNFAATTSMLTGITILVFVVWHVADMKFGEPHIATADRDLYTYVINVFSSQLNVFFYTLAIALLSIHLFNGLGTLYESFGIAHRSWLRRIGQGYAILLTTTFASLPILIHLLLVPQS